jgi:hypothetical protein
LKSGKSARDHKGQKPVGPPRNRAPNSTAMVVLSKKFETKTFDGYTMSAKLLEKAYLAPIQKAVSYLNILKTHAWKALSCFIEDILDEAAYVENDAGNANLVADGVVRARTEIVHDDRDDSSGQGSPDDDYLVSELESESEDDRHFFTATSTREHLRLLTHGLTSKNGGVLFFQGLLNFIKSGHYSGADPLVCAFLHWHNELAFSFCLEEAVTAPKGIHSSIEEMAREMDTAFAGLVVGRVVELAAKVLKIDPLQKEPVNRIELVSMSATETYYRINQLLPVEKRLKICPDTSVSDSFVTLTSDTLTFLLELGTDPNSKGSTMEKLFGGTNFGRNRKIGLMASSVNIDVMAALKLSDDEIAEKQALFIQDDPARKDPRYLFRQTLKTNGQELQVHVLDLSAPCKRGGSSAVSSDSLVQLAGRFLKRPKKDRGTLPAEVKEKIGEYALCGIDFGQAYFAAYVKRPPIAPAVEPTHVQMTFKMKALQQPTKKHAFWLKTQKDSFGKVDEVPAVDYTEEDLTDSEDELFKVDLDADSPEDLSNSDHDLTDSQDSLPIVDLDPVPIDPHMPLDLTDIYALERSMEKHADEDWQVYMSRFRIVHPILSAFYNSKAMKKRKNYLKKALKGEAYFAVDRLLKACGSSSGVDRKLPEFKPVVFLIGDSDIGTGTWSSFETICVERLRALGHIVLLRWEHNTSQMCPKETCNHQQMEYQGEGIRVKYCRSCHLFYHRDVVAAENNVYIFLFELKNGYRPFQYSTKKQQADWGNLFLYL